MIDIELRSALDLQALIRKAQSRRIGVIGSFHDFNGTPSDDVLRGAADLALQFNLDAVKIATTLRGPGDLARLIQFLESMKRLPVSIMGMGGLGRASRLVLARCGSVLNYGASRRVQRPGTMARAPVEGPPARNVMPSPAWPDDCSLYETAPACKMRPPPESDLMIRPGPPPPRSRQPPFRHRAGAWRRGLAARRSRAAGFAPRKCRSPPNLSDSSAENERLRKQLGEVTDEFRHYRNVIAGNQARGPIPGVRAGRVIVVDAKTGDILAEKNADERGPVASTQKLLTALLVVESGDLEEYLTVQDPDIDCAPVRIGLKVGETYPRIQLLTALLVKSSNDIAQALARDNAGSIEAFVDRMNGRARVLGMNDSHFVNPHGLPADDQYSTARDMARLALVTDANPVIRDLVEVRRFDFPKADGRMIRLENTNRVMRDCEFCDGMKTGLHPARGPLPRVQRGKGRPAPDRRRAQRR